jgi:hypothetical protein
MFPLRLSRERIGLLASLSCHVPARSGKRAEPKSLKPATAHNAQATYQNINRTPATLRKWLVLSCDSYSVKTTAMMDSAGHVSFNVNTLEHVDRVMVLRMNTAEMQIETLLDAPLEKALEMMSGEKNGRRDLALSKLLKPKRPIIDPVKIVEFKGYTIRELENGTIEVEKLGQLIIPAKPALRELAMSLNIPIVNGSGNALNTRALGSLIIKSICQLNEPDMEP